MSIVSSFGSTMAATVGAREPHLIGDPFWADVILHLNGDDLGNFKRDWSPLAFATGANGSPGPSLNTTQQKYGPGCIDLSGGEVTVATENVYTDLMLADEFTLRWWTYVLSFPLNVNDRIAFFGPFQMAIDAGGGGGGLGTEIEDSGGTGRTLYAPLVAEGAYPVGQWVHSALTRTNQDDGINAHIDIFVQGQIQTPSSTFPSVNPVSGNGGFRFVGGGGGTSCLIDDFQLTKRVNRYRGLTSFTPPTRLPTFQATG